MSLRRTLPAAVLLLIVTAAGARAEGDEDFGEFARRQADRAALQDDRAGVAYWNEQFRLHVLQRDAVRRAEAARAEAAAADDPSRRAELETTAEEQKVRAAEYAAVREENSRRRDARERVREQLELLADQAAALRAEGASDEARAVEAAMRELLRANDPDFGRINLLVKRSIRARLAGDHADADLYRREADRLREVVRLRYADDDERAAAARTDATVLLDEVRKLRTEVADLRRAVADLSPPKPGVEQAGNRADVEGVVTATRDGFVEISIGADDGLRKGDRLHAFDLAAKRFLARVEVVHVTPDRAVCRVIEKADAKVELEKGHRVASKP